MRRPSITPHCRRCTGDQTSASNEDIVQSPYFLGRCLMTKWILPFCAIALSTAAVAPAQADVRVGTLRCAVTPGVSYLIGSQKGLNCVYYSALGYTERYVGGLGRLGIDVGYTTGGALAWWVYAPS